MKTPIWKDRRIWSVLGVFMLGVSCLALITLLRHRLIKVVEQAAPAEQIMYDAADPTQSPTPFQPVTPTSTSTPVPVRTAEYILIAIDANDVGTFENAGDHSQLIAQCIDPGLKTPAVKTLYALNARNILFPRDPMQVGVLQRFQVR